MRNKLFFISLVIFCTSLDVYSHGGIKDMIKIKIIKHISEKYYNDHFDVFSICHKDKIVRLYYSPHKEHDIYILYNEELSGIKFNTSIVPYGVAFDNNDNLFLFIKDKSSYNFKIVFCQDSFFDIPPVDFSRNVQFYSLYPQETINYGLFFNKFTLNISTTFGYKFEDYWNKRYGFSTFIGKNKKSTIKINTQIKNSIMWNLKKWNANTYDALLFQAVENNDINKIKLLIKNGANPNAVSPAGRSVLMNAVFFNNLNAVKLLLESGANLEYKNRNGETAIFYAVYSDNENILNYLIARGANIFIQNNYGENILMTAVQCNTLAPFEIFKKHISSLNICKHDRECVCRLFMQKNKYNESILHYMAYSFKQSNKFFSIFKDLLSATNESKLLVDVNQDNDSVLMYIIHSMICSEINPDIQLEAIKHILQSDNIDLSSKNKFGYTPKELLQKVSEFNSLNYEELLRERYNIKFP